MGGTSESCNRNKVGLALGLRPIGIMTLGLGFRDHDVRVLRV